MMHAKKNIKKSQNSVWYYRCGKISPIKNFASMC